MTFRGNVGLWLVVFLGSCRWQFCGFPFEHFIRATDIKNQRTSKCSKKLKPVAKIIFFLEDESLLVVFFSGWISGCFSRFTQTPSFLKYVSRFFWGSSNSYPNSCWTPPDQEIRLCTADRDKTKKALDALKRRKVGARWSCEGSGCRNDVMSCDVIISVVVSNIFYVQPYLGNWCNLTI